MVPGPFLKAYELDQIGNLSAAMNVYERHYLPGEIDFVDQFLS